MRNLIKDVFNKNFLNNFITVYGWVRTIRRQKNFSFIELNDGSSLKNLQVIFESSVDAYDEIIDDITTGCSIKVEGKIVESPAKGQSIELLANNINVIGKCPESYPLQKKRHSQEFLREIAHLRPRTNLIGAVSRVASSLALATHNFFAENGFTYVRTPIITTSDCEGAGKMFKVSTEDEKNGENYFFGKPAFLTVSGQLNAEMYACGLGNVYTFGPTFRAENSNTSRHLAEFWMVEPEMAFADINDDIECADKYIKYMISHVMEKNIEDLSLFNNFIEKGLLDRLNNILDNKVEVVKYSEAISILENANKKFEYSVKWGIDLQSEHERFLTEEYFKKPITVIDYPKAIKPFYMRENEDGLTVSAMDVLVPKIGEIIGGSQREERLDILVNNIKKYGLNEEDYQSYIDLRKYGSVPHAGFGLGFERMIQLVTSVENIREVIPFPRYPGKALF